MLIIDPQEVETTYQTKKDNKKRVTAESRYDYFEVTVLRDGTMVFQPRILVDPQALSKEVFAQIKESLLNVAKGKVGRAIDIDGGEAILKEFRRKRLKAKK